MDKHLEQIYELLTLIDERELTVQSYNKDIIKLLSSTVVMALTELLDISDVNIRWDNIELMDSQLKLTFEITYVPTINKSKILNSEPVKDNSSTEVQLPFHLTFPLSEIFTSVDNIKTILLTAFDTPVAVENNKLSYITNNTQPSILLSKDQIRQILFFQKMYTGTKQ